VRLPRVLTRAGSLAMIAAAALPLATTACTPDTGPKVISGVLRGANGSYVDAMIGFDILDAQGRKIQANGTPVTNGGYGALIRLNYCLSSAGSQAATPGCDGQNLTDQWSLQLPSNAVRVYVEAYPKAPSSGAWVNNYRGYTGPNPGNTDETTFGMTYRRSIPVFGSGASGVSLVAPTVCGKPGGSTGTLWGYIYRGNTLWRATGGITDAWSTEADNAPILGMNEGRVDPGVGTYHITNLQGGSHYTIVATVDGVTKQWLAGVQPVVNSCSSTRFDLHF
jgi:hypothetical protein